MFKKKTSETYLENSLEMTAVRNYKHMHHMKMLMEGKEEYEKPEYVIDIPESDPDVPAVKRNIWSKDVLLDLLTGVLCCIVITACFMYKPVMTKPYLMLSAEETDLPSGSHFDAMSYVISYSDGKGTLTLPEIDMNHKGRQAAVYTLKIDNTAVVKVLYVNVI